MGENRTLSPSPFAWVEHSLVDVGHESRYSHRDLPDQMPPRMVIYRRTNCTRRWGRSRERGYIDAMAPKKKPDRVIGWRELLNLPELTSVPIKAKIDTGARTSALHAFDLRVEDNNGLQTVVFEIHPLQRSSARAKLVTLPLHRFRKVKSSSGQTELRPSIVTTAVLGQVSWPIELTLTSRDSMGFRMLLGRSALRRRFLVNPGRSYIMSDKPRPKDPSRP